ncbi:MAG: regulatory iron-sulfur-containing complex subunit RicT [Gemmatimonadetes bacterium]|nr:regulatory iron-sulfur-containing complex subunit RicT [Gemmatimonadota bacterium]
MVIEVTFKGNRREFFNWPFPEAPAVKVPVIVQVEHGEDFGHVHATGELALKRKAGTTHGKATRSPLRKVIRAASGEEIARAGQLRADEFNVRVRAIEKVRTLRLDLKVSDTEWQHDKKRLTIFFTAEQRVDFRHLVRQLEGLFGTRIHMWHIGVRDEAKRVDGLGRCGRQLCSASWLPELIPVKSSVAKDQHLSTLNPAQISGSCGRLMCCLRYEHEFYVQQRKRFPKEGKIVRTALGEEKVVSLDIFRETVTLRSAGGDARIVPLDELKLAIAEELAKPSDPDSGGPVAAAAAVATEPTKAAGRRPRRPESPASEGRPREGRPREQGRGRQNRPPRRGNDAGATKAASHGATAGPGGGVVNPSGADAAADPVNTADATSAADATTLPAAAQSVDGGPQPRPPAHAAPDDVPNAGAGAQPDSGSKPSDGAGRRRRRGRRGGRRGHGPEGRGSAPSGEPGPAGAPPETPLDGRSELPRPSGDRRNDTPSESST